MTDAQIAPATDAAPGRRIHSDAAWTSVRDAYLSGEAGESAAARHGISSTAFWRRAAEDGWLRRDRPEAARPPFDPRRSILDEEAQLTLAGQRLSDALERGNAGEVLRWQRVRERIEGYEDRRRAGRDRDERDKRRRSHEEVKALTTVARDIERVARAGLSHVQTETLRQKVEDELAGRESRESKNSGDGTPTLLDPDAPGLSRAERRRRLKYRARHGAAPDP